LRYIFSDTDAVNEGGTTGPVQGRRAKGNGERGRMCWVHFVFMYENRNMETAEVVLRRGWGDEGEWWRGGSIKIYGKHLCKCHNVSPSPTIKC
jgi:hypothetical protein